MNLDINVNGYQPAAVRPVTGQGSPGVKAPPPAARQVDSAGRVHSTDHVELSEAGLAHAMKASVERIAHQQQIKAEIQAGTYETPERIEGTVDRLLDVLA
jgi:anti-sigma28 factor (negative regulator of flagellin synthesis)